MPTSIPRAGYRSIRTSWWSSPVTARTKKREDYQKNAYQLAQGKTLFKQMNCNGCHSNGGGGMGPALIDDEWIYGSSIENIVATIREGRPNGMPSYRGKVTDDQIWQIAAYVVSMGGKVPSAAAPSRDDAMSNLPGESRRLIQMRYDREYGNVADLARRLGRTVQSVYAQLKRIKVALRECVSRRLALEQS